MKKRILPLILAVIMVCGLSPMTSTASAETRVRVVEGQRISQEVPVGDIRDYFYTIVMPYDGILNLNVNKTGNLTLTDYTFSGSSARNFSGKFNNGTMQFTLRQGEHSFSIRDSSDRPGGGRYEFDFFVSTSRDTTWKGTVDPEPNDTPAI